MFEIRVLTSDREYLLASQLIESVDSYGEVPLELIKDTLMYGMSMEDGSMFGCAMVIRQGPQAYVDYLTIHPLMQNEGYAQELTKYVYNALKLDGVKIIHACVSGENGPSLRACSKLRPLIGFPFTKMTFELKEEGNSHG